MTIRSVGRWAAVALGGLSLVCCAHEKPKVESDASLEEQARRDLGPDPFRDLDAGAPGAAPPAVLPPAPAPSLNLRDEDDAALKQLSGSDCAAFHAGITAHPHASSNAVREALTAAERCEERAKNLAAARQTARAILGSCGPEGVDRCRARALALMKKLAGQQPRDAALTARVKEIADADACLLRAEGSVNKDPPLDPCLARADGVYQAMGDDLMSTRAKLARARHAAHKNEPRAEKLLRDAAAGCVEPRCSPLRTRAWEALAGWAQGQSRPELVLEARLRQDQVAAEALPADRRAYVRSAKTDAACAALETSQGPGSCRALEKRLMGAFTFHDWSAKSFPGDLPKDEALKVNDDFQPTLQDCFRDEAARLPVPSTVSYRVRWMIGLDGRVDQVHLDPPADDAGPLAQCLRARFSLWRYPKSGGENQHVEQGFTLTAKPR